MSRVRRLLRLVIAIPLLLLLVLFALTPGNRAAVPLGLWPTDIVWVAPLSIIVLAAAALFFFIGALVVWLASLGKRLRARRAEGRVRTVEAPLAAAAPRASPSRGVAVP